MLTKNQINILIFLVVLFFLFALVLDQEDLFCKEKPDSVACNSVIANKEQIAIQKDGVEAAKDLDEQIGSAKK